MKHDEVIELAEQAAAFLRNLILDDVPLSAATAMASSFVTARILSRTREPNETWGGGSE